MFTSPTGLCLTLHSRMNTPSVQHSRTHIPEPRKDPHTHFSVRGWMRCTCGDHHVLCIWALSTRSPCLLPASSHQHPRDYPWGISDLNTLFGTWELLLFFNVAESLKPAHVTSCLFPSSCCVTLLPTPRDVACHLVNELGFTGKCLREPLSSLISNRRGQFLLEVALKHLWGLLRISEADKGPLPAQKTLGFVQHKKVGGGGRYLQKRMMMGFLGKNRAFVKGEEIREIGSGPPKMFMAPAVWVLYKIWWSSTEASWAGCPWRQEQGAAAICSQESELALVNKIQELTAWKFLGAQCFLQGHDRWGWAQSLTFRAGVNSCQTAGCPETSLGRWKLCLYIAGRVICLELFLNVQDTAIPGKISDFSHTIPLLGRAFFIWNLLRRGLVLDLLGHGDHSPSEVMQGNTAFNTFGLRDQRSNHVEESLRSLKNLP